MKNITSAGNLNPSVNKQNTKKKKNNETTNDVHTEITKAEDEKGRLKIY